MPNMRLRVRLPQELLDRLMLDSKPVENEPGFGDNYGGGWKFSPPAPK